MRRSPATRPPMRPPAAPCAPPAPLPRTAPGPTAPRGVRADACSVRPSPPCRATKRGERLKAWRSRGDRAGIRCLHGHREVLLPQAAIHDVPVREPAADELDRLGVRLRGDEVLPLLEEAGQGLAGLDLRLDPHLRRQLQLRAHIADDPDELPGVALRG